MDQPQETTGGKIAAAAGANENLRTRHERRWIAVFLNEDTIVIALHGCLSAVEKSLTQSPAGAAQVQEFHRQLFTNDPAVLLRKIKSMTGMNVRGTTFEIEPTTGSVVHLFTTDTAREQFLLAPSNRLESERRDAIRLPAMISAPTSSPTKPLGV